MKRLLDTINSLDKKYAFAWSLVGLVLAVVLGILSIYTDFIRSAQPKLQLEVLGNEPVLDVREKLPDLEVIYQAQDIAKIGRTLSVILVRVANRGSADLLNAFYDTNAPVKIKIADGKLVRSEVSDTSNDYLRNTAKLSKSGEDVSISPVIIERDEWFTVKLLVLHDINRKPSLSGDGKIAGQHQIDVITAADAKAEVGFFAATFYGSIAIQLVRIPVYFIGTFLLLVSVVIPLSLLSDHRKKTKRERLVKSFKETTRLALVPADDFIMTRFIALGDFALDEAIKLAEDEKMLERQIRDYFEHLNTVKSSTSLSAERRLRDLDQISDGLVPSYVPMRHSTAKQMIEAGFVEDRDGKWTVSDDRLSVAKALQDCVKFAEEM